MENSINKFNKNNKAITLIALVITIVILIILAGVSIMAITSTGLFDKAKLAKMKTVEATAKESLELVESDWQIEKNSNQNANIETFLQDAVKSQKIDNYDKDNENYNIYKDNYYITIDKNGNKISDIKQKESDDVVGGKLKRVSPKLGVNLGEKNDTFEVVTGNPVYMGKNEGVYLENTLLKTECPLNTTYTILVESKGIKFDHSPNYVGGIVSYGNGGAYWGGSCLGIYECNTSYKYIAGISGAGDSYALASLSTSNDISKVYIANQWNILAIKWDGSEFSLWINGKKQGKSSASTRKGSTLYVGGLSNQGAASSGYYWSYSNSYYRKLAIYDEALTDEEMANYQF